MKLSKDLITGALAILLFTLVLGVGYPLVITGVAQIAFRHQADGSLIVKDGKTVGSTLIGTAHVIGRRPDPAYFQPRPSATGYSASATYFANRGPNSSAARLFYRDGLAAYRALEGPYTPGLTNAQVPVDAVTASASGVDPQISKANAAIQAKRVAAVRKLPLDRVRALVAKHTDGRWLGVIGEPGVNLPALNTALDQEVPTP